MYVEAIVFHGRVVVAGANRSQLILKVIATFLRHIYCAHTARGALRGGGGEESDLITTSLCLLTILSNGQQHFLAADA